MSRASVAIGTPRWLSVPLTAVALVAAGCGGGDEPDGVATTEGTTSDQTGSPAGNGGDGQAQGSTVDIVNFEFAPMTIEVSTGTTVEWVNRDSAVHTVLDRSDANLFEESSDLGMGDTFTYTYDEPGEYPYICGIHQYMKGTVTVTG